MAFRYFLKSNFEYYQKIEVIATFAFAHSQKFGPATLSLTFVQKGEPYNSAPIFWMMVDLDFDFRIGLLANEGKHGRHGFCAMVYDSKDMVFL